VTGPDPYGGQHKARRRQLLAQLARSPGLPCPRCGMPMHIGMRLDLGHADPAAKLRGLPGDRLEHAACNRRAGQAITAAILRARGGLTPRQLTAMRMRQWRAAAARQARRY
jgi:hypothetical protein